MSYYLTAFLIFCGFIFLPYWIGHLIVKHSTFRYLKTVREGYPDKNKFLFKCIIGTNILMYIGGIIAGSILLVYSLIKY